MVDLNQQQFLYHGTAREIQGDRIEPAAGKHESYWGTAGSGRGEPANQFAWAHPSESKAWEFALDRADSAHTNEYKDVAPRASVQAVHPHPEQSAGHDPSIPGEVKAPHFKIAQQHDIMPGRQGTFPGINWNEHVRGGSVNLPGTEDANHPSHLSVQFGHREGAKVDPSRQDTAEAHEYISGRLHHETKEADAEIANDRSRAVMPRYKMRAETEDTPFPPAPKGARR